jgi:hypothetical protein
MKKIAVAYLEIRDPSTGESVYTVHEFCETPEKALEQFRELDRVISAWSSSAEGLILNTTAGWVRFPSDLITQSLIKLNVEYIESYEDEVAGDQNTDGE